MPRKVSKNSEKTARSLNIEIECEIKKQQEEINDKKALLERRMKKLEQQRELDEINRQLADLPRKC